MTIQYKYNMHFIFIFYTIITPRLAVVLVQENSNKLLCVAKVEESTGKVEAEKVKEVLDNWGVTEKVIACGFDTTSANTGVHKGACVLLQELLQRLLLWLACRHHILELILGAAFIKLFGKTTGPEVQLFKKLKECWETLDKTDLQLPTIPPAYNTEKDELLLYIDSKLENSHQLPRCDYKELLELAKLFLGGEISRKKGYSYQLSRPGADHHAR